ncbi:MAG: RibD family protein [Pseudomonadota bacterium]
MSSEFEDAKDRSEHDQAWRLLLTQRDLFGSSPIRRQDISNEITTSQLTKLFQKAGQKTRDLIDLYGPLNHVDRDGFLVAHLGQSLDGRIAALNGASRWITGPEDVRHNHRMRALADAVVVGASTVCYDDPQLTVRGIEGRSPVRVVIDPRRRLREDLKVFSDGAVETLLLCRESERRACERHGDSRIIGLDDEEGGLSPARIVEALRALGLNRIFVEGGGMTISRFLEAGCLDRLQITVAPVILGSGRPSIVLAEIEDVAKGLRPPIRQFRLGNDTLFECCFDGQG